jgi:diguanylate cyclase (GGDEF)-like protein
MHRRSSDVWIVNGVLAAAAAVIFVLFVMPLPQTWSAMHLALPLMASMFLVGESWRVYIHFRRNAQSYSLSEIVTVIGLFFVTPDELIVARLAGAAVGLGLVRRHPPVKLVFNLVAFSLESEVVLILFNHLVAGGSITSPLTWVATLLVVGAGSLCGFLLTAAVITLAEGSAKRRQWIRPALVVIIGGLANASLGLEVVAAVSRNAWELLLLLLPIAVLLAAYTLYTQEHQKRQQLQYLYQSSDLLQRATTHQSALPELLLQLCSVFRAEVAELTLLPSATGGDKGYALLLNRGVASDQEQPVSLELLDRFTPVLVEDTRGAVVARGRGHNDDMRRWLETQGLRDAMIATLQSDGILLGALVVGNRLSDVSTFDDEDLTLFETFAAQASVAVMNTRLGHRLKHQAFHDPLTGLANRALFTDRLEHAMTRRDQDRGGLAVIFLDLDDFKMINDSLGHTAGDELLRAVADRLLTVLRPSDTAARLGGDEFAILLEGGDAPYDVIAVAERIVSVLKPHFTTHGKEVAVHASVGVATSAAPTVAAGELLRRADVAMYRAKMRGKNSFEVFEPGMQEVVTRRLEVRTDLERALERDELVLHYQPFVDLDTRMPVGVEALVRWQHPRWGLVGPGEFISIAEETGLIRDIGLWVLETACRQCQEWQTAFPDQNGFFVSVNVSPRQLRQPDFADAVWAVLSRTGLHPSRLVLEITESFMVEDPERASDRLHSLKALGVRLSIDDFGTGYSSLATLQELPIDILKIDKAFVDHVADDPRRAAFAQAIIRMGKTLGLALVAEGVERQEQAERLHTLGCRIAQGHHFCRPVEPAVIERMLAAVPQDISFQDPSRVTADAGDTLLVLPVAGDDAMPAARPRSRLA